MKQYMDLDLKKIMDAENLDFARWTFGRGQCSCCYGPFDMPARYWRGGNKPIYHETPIFTETGCSVHYELNGKAIGGIEDIKYILFKNACNGSGIVRAKDFIKDYTCIAYHLDDLDQVRRICAMLREQLDDDYIVQEPDSMMTCIIIRVRDRLVNGY